MKISLTCFSVLLCLLVQGQKIKQITGSKTYLYPDSGYKSVKIDSNQVIVYDIKGRLLRNSNVELICHEYYAYNEKDELIEEKSYCGEGYSECYTQRNGKVSTTRCQTNYHESIKIDSLNEDGKTISTYSEMKSDDSFSEPMKTEIYHSLYEYDKTGKEILYAHWGPGYHSAIRRKYSENGQLSCVVLNDTVNHRSDSTIYSFDELGRIIEMKKFGGRMKDGQYAEFTLLNFLYSPMNKNKTEKANQRFNDTLLTEHLPYSPFTYDLPRIIHPMEITCSIVEMKNQETPLSKTKYNYGYDSKGRMISIQGNDFTSDTTKHLFEVKVEYLPEQRISVSKKENWLNYVYLTKREYVNNLLLSILELDPKDEKTVQAKYEYTYEYFE